MQQGRPLFSQEVAPKESKSLSESELTQAKERADSLRKRLQFGPLTDHPVMVGQEEMFPDSVVRVGMKFEVLEPESAEDMVRYSQLNQSTQERGAEVIVAEDIKWSDTTGSWKVLVKISKRKFRALSAAHEAELIKTENEQPENTQDV